jgi:hypothetical protein
MVTTLLCSYAYLSDRCYTDIIIKASSPKYQSLLDHAQLSAQIIVGKEVIDETQPVASEPMEAMWRLKGSLQL